MLHCYWDYCWISRKTMKAAFTNSCGKEKLYTQVLLPVIVQYLMWIEEEVATKVVVTEANPRNYRSKWINNMFKCWNCGKTRTWKKKLQRSKAEWGEWNCCKYCYMWSTECTYFGSWKSIHDTLVLDSDVSFILLVNMTFWKIMLQEIMERCIFQMENLWISLGSMTWI